MAETKKSLPLDAARTLRSAAMDTKTELPMPPANANLQTTWEFLEPRIDQLMTYGFLPPHGISYWKYMKLPTVVYNYCMSHGTSASIRDRADLRLVDLYNNLIRYLVVLISTLRDTLEPLVDEELLRHYVYEWERYINAISRLDHCFMHLNRMQRGTENVYPVYVLALVQWKIHFFPYAQDKPTRLVSTILKLIDAERDGLPVDQNVVKKVIDSFVTLGTNKEYRASLEVYKGAFESHFIAATEKYYKTESDRFLAQKSISAYLKRAEERLREEEDRVERYLNADTRRILLNKCEHVLIGRHSEEMWDEFQRLLDYDKDEDLQRMYALLARIPEGLEPLRRQFEEYVKRAGHRAISKLVTIGGTDADLLEQNTYVDSLFDVCRRHEDILERNFNREGGFVVAFEKACRDFVNRNAATGTDIVKSPELLAMSADALLHKSSRFSEEGGLEEALDRLISVLKYLSEKDVFQIFYSNKLAKRLIYHVSLSDTAEASMIFKLKEVCPFQFTNKIQRMFNDMNLSRELTAKFGEHLKQSGDTTGGDITLDITVLGTNSWPLHAPEHEFVIPREILATYERFTSYYQSSHSGRKLTWLWNYSTNRLRAYYLNQKYILVTTSYQMAVLLQYEKDDSLSLDELINSTGISKGLLVQILGLLVRMKLLVNEEPEQYDLNLKFTSKKICVNLNLPMKAEITADNVRVLRAVDEERRYVIQATIVRVMKARTTLKNQALITEVISQVSMRFTPKVSDIKRAIETLLEKDYLERVEGQHDTYRYLT